MLNPNEIANKQFSKGRGYRAEEVDSYLRQIASDIGELIEEKRDLEKKMMVLADKLEEYKEDEESLRAALLGAQKLGDSVVREAKAKAQSLLEDAEAQAVQLVENAKKEIERQQQGFVRLQREVATFKSKLQLVYKQHLELISSIPVDENIVEAAMKKARSNSARNSTSSATTTSAGNNFRQDEIDKTRREQPNVRTGLQQNIKPSQDRLLDEGRAAAEGTRHGRKMGS